MIVAIERERRLECDGRRLAKWIEIAGPQNRIQTYESVSLSVFSVPHRDIQAQQCPAPWYVFGLRVPMYPDAAVDELLDSLQER